MLVEWALTSSFLILAVLLMRALLGRRVSAVLRYALWAVVLVRLLVPVQLFPSPIAGARLVSELRAARPAASAPADYSTATAPESAPAASDETPARTAGGTANLLLALWAAGAAGMALVLLFSNLRFYHRLRKRRVLLENAACPLRVYAADGLPSPCLFGLFRPAIYVTPEAAGDKGALRHVLAHEGTHFRHGDPVWSLLRCAALAVHWWNPLVWVAAAESRRDCELACDEGALKTLGDGERRAYGHTLLALVTQKTRPQDLLTCSTAMTGGKRSLRERVRRIAHKQKRWAWAAAAVVLAGALACACAFGASNEERGYSTDAVAASLDAADGRRFVRLSGATLDHSAAWQAAWYPQGMSGFIAGHPGGELYLPDYPLTDGAAAQVTAFWADEEHTAVTLCARMDAAAGGSWTFTVDLTVNGGSVTRMEPFAPGAGFAPLTPAHPERISGKDAANAGLTAARLLTAAESFYEEKMSEQDGLSAP